MKKLPALVIIIFILGILASPRHGLAQGDGTVHGVVHAQADQSPLPNAEVRLEGVSISLSRQTTAGPDGHFALRRLPPGEYTLVVGRSDFLEQRLLFTLKPREVRNFALELELLPVTEAVTVTAEAQTVAPTFSPSSTTIQQRNFDLFPASQRTNLPEVIAVTVPGMVRSHDDFVHVRGSELALNVFINGVSFWENPHAVFSPGLAPDVIQSMNVMTGGFPAEYGNRFGGILDVVTKSGFSMNNEGSITLGAGQALRHNAAIEFGGHTERAGYYFYSSAFESSRFLSPPDQRSIHNTGRGMRNFLQLDFNVNANNFLKLTLLGDGTNFEIPKTALDDQLRPELDASQRTRSQTAIFSWDRILSTHSLLHAAFYQRWSRSTLLPGVESHDQLAAITDAERTLNTVGFKTDVTRFFNRHTLKGGVDLVMLRPHEKLFYDYEGFGRFSHHLGADRVHFHGPITFDRTETGGQASLYLQDEMQVTNNLTVDLGLRFDRYSLAMSDYHFSPRLNVSYRFDGTGTVLYGSYNHFYIPPVVENVLLSSAGLSGHIREIGTALPPLRPVVENQFELGVTQPFHSSFQLGLAAYYRISNDQAHTVLLPDSRIYNYANFDKAEAWGMEIKAQVPTLPRLGLSGYLNYALGRVYLFNPVVAGFTASAGHGSGAFLAPMDQTHTLSAGFTWRHPSGFWTNMIFEYGSGTPAHGHSGGHGMDHGGGMMDHTAGMDHDAGMMDHEAGMMDHDAGHAGQTAVAGVTERVPSHFTQNLTLGMDLFRDGEQPRVTLQFNIENLSNNFYQKTAPSIFSPGEFSIPRLYSGSIKFRF